MDEERPERRKAARVPKRATITCQRITHPLGQEPEQTADMVDVSEGGVRLRTPGPWEVGDLVQVALLLPGWQRHSAGFLRYDETSVSKPLTAVGRVVRSQRLGSGTHEVGVEFTGIWDDHWRAMRIYLEGEIARQRGSGSSRQGT